jgi:alpha-glucosidase
MVDFGYDVADYCDVDPSFGTLADFDDLLTQAHRRGLKVLVDFVPNHTSDQHAWFVESRSSQENQKRNWYIWRDPADTGKNIDRERPLFKVVLQSVAEADIHT